MKSAYRKRLGKTHQAEQSLTASQLHALFRYEDGQLFWRMDVGPNKCKGRLAGCRDTFGHRQIRINNTTFKAHRLVWIMFYGSACPSDIDHINKIPDDNRIENLRETNDQLNRANARYQKKSRSGFKGVAFRKERNKYVAMIRINGKVRYLGHYINHKEAAAAYNSAAKKAFGDFAVLNDLGDE